MSMREVKLVKCDRCEAEVVLDLCAYDTPDGWLTVQGCGDLCKECAHQFKAFVMNFFDGNVPEEWRLPRCY